MIDSAPAESWRRLHPLSPVIRFGGLLIAVAVIAVPTLETARPRGGRSISLYPLVWGTIVVIGTVSAVLQWLVTRWRIDGADLRIETGVIRRQSLRIPLSRIQAVDIVAPLAARLFGLAEVRVVSAGRGSERGRLAYLSSADAVALRARLLALAHGLAPETPEPPAVPLLHVDNTRLIAGLTVRAPVVVPLLLMAGAIVAVALSPGPGVAAVSTMFTFIVAAVLAVGRAFNEDFDFTISEAGDGVRLDRGLLQRRHETIPFGRIQAVRLTQPLLWRPFGWWRLEVDVARQHAPREGSGREAASLSRTLVPVGDRTHALWILSRVFPGSGVTPPAGAEPPRRAVWKAPLSFHYLAAWAGNRYVYARTGRVQQATVIAPLDKVQSFRLDAGPVQRWLRLATMHVDTAGQRWQASARCRDGGEAWQLLWELSNRARTARGGGTTMAISSRDGGDGPV
ncbi:MAG: PH domain-containing protein [Candidatus Dormibacteraeota bacterium]|nr:PH domain-containing protein [Candidatus Dormibacteraeota bacterium]